MKIKNIHIYELGKFNNFIIPFKDDISFIYGENEAGKSTIFEAIKVSISGFSNIKNYSYIPIGSNEASVSCDFDSFSVQRKLSRSVSGYLTFGEEIKRINNNPVYSIDRDIIQDIYTVDSDDILGVSDKSVDKIIESVLYDSNLKKYNSIGEIEANIVKKKKELYSNRSGSKKELNIIDSRIKEIENEIFEYEKRERNLIHRKTELEDVVNNLDAKLLSENKLMDKVKEEQMLITKGLDRLGVDLSVFSDYVKDDSSCVGLSYSLLPIIIALVLSIGLIIFGKLIYALFVVLAYFIYKFAYFSRAIRLTKIPFLLKNKFVNIKSIQKGIYDKRTHLSELTNRENEIYERIVSLDESRIRYELNSLDERLDNFYSYNDINLLKQKLKDLNIKRDNTIKSYNRYILLEKLFEHSKNSYVRGSLKDILSSASNYLAHFTNGEYNSILKGDGSYFIKGDKNFQKEEGYLSRGTKSQLYLALRLALADYFDNGDTRPIFFDDAFVHFDKERTYSTLKFLTEYSKTRQIIVFTSKKYDIEGVTYEEIRRS